MKNKKMVATLASLCLIVVAVVAAVVGVLAAVQQNFHATVDVRYFAKNVDALVTLKSKGPFNDNGTLNNETSWQEETNNSHDFDPMQGHADATLVGKEYDLGWDSVASATNFRGVVIYQFTIVNEHQTHDLQVTLDYDATKLTNLSAMYYRSGVSDLGLDDIQAVWAPAGGLTTSGDDAYKIKNSEFYTDGDSSKPALYTVVADNTAWTMQENTTEYVYVILALTSGGADASISSGYLAFTLIDPTNPD